MADLSAEFSFIDWIRQRIPAHSQVPLGIGDDAALLNFAKNSDALVTVDMLMEGTDFTFPPATPKLAGRKALAVNLSDIAAMAGTPTAAFVSVSLPRSRGVEFAKELFEGILELTAEFGVAIAGGDTNAWDGPLVISITVIGSPPTTGAVTRSGARIGDWIMTTGSFGGSLSGHHLSFTPRVREAAQLAAAANLHALIDVSDGLAADLAHILDESGVGAIVDARCIPISDAANQSSDGRSPLDHALGDGEDFELIFTVSPADGARLLANPPCDVLLSHVGEITSGPREIILPNGSRAPLIPIGWTHAF